MLNLTKRQVEILKERYIEFDTPVDRFIRHRTDLIQFVDEFNDRVGGMFDPDEVLHYMMTQRKRGLWPRIRRNYHGRECKSHLN